MEIEYSGKYYAHSREDLVQQVKNALSPERFAHVLRVEQTALALASQYGADLEKTSIAALVHDYAKERSQAEFEQEIIAKQLDRDLLNWNNFIWHGVVGAEMIKDELKITDEEILDAVRRHTVGASYMTLLDQVIYVADYIEPGRDFPGVKAARAIAKEDLQAAVAFETKHTLSYLIEAEKTIYPAAINTYNSWVAK